MGALEDTQNRTENGQRFCLDRMEVSPGYALDPALKDVAGHFREAFVAADDREQAALLHPGYQEESAVKADGTGLWPLLGSAASLKWVAIPAHVIVEYLGPAMCGEGFGFIRPPL